MPPPPLWASVRQTLARALRETGRAVDRVATWAEAQAEHMTRHRIGVGAEPATRYDTPLSRHRTVVPLLHRGAPRISPDANLVAPCATLVGRVTIGPGSSVWYGAVLRADRGDAGMGNHQQDDDEDDKERWCSAPRPEDGVGGGVYVGHDTNLQDGVIVSADETSHTTIGDRVTVGHGAHLRSTTIGNDALVGMGAVLRPGSVIEDGAFVAAGAVVGEGVTVPSGELWVGDPARRARELTAGEKERMAYQASEYVKLSGEHAHVMDLGGNVSAQTTNPLIEEGEKADNVVMSDRNKI